MKYAFVSLSVLAVWMAIILVIYFLKYEGVLLPLLAIFMTVALFIIGFVRKK
jgi:hypothetical protein